MRNMLKVLQKGASWFVVTSCVIVESCHGDLRLFTSLPWQHDDDTLLGVKECTHNKIFCVKVKVTKTLIHKSMYVYNITLNMYI